MFLYYLVAKRNKYKIVDLETYVSYVYNVYSDKHAVFF
jgi:hypothetical protein